MRRTAQQLLLVSCFGLLATADEDLRGIYPAGRYVTYQFRSPTFTELARDFPRGPLA